MVVKKYVLLIDEREGTLVEIADDLKELGYDVARAADFHAALNAIASLDRPRSRTTKRSSRRCGASTRSCRCSGSPTRARS
jgi:hypothetical protein